MGSRGLPWARRTPASTSRRSSRPPRRRARRPSHRLPYAARAVRHRRCRGRPGPAAPRRRPRPGCRRQRAGGAAVWAWACGGAPRTVSGGCRGLAPGGQCLRLRCSGRVWTAQAGQERPLPETAWRPSPSVRNVRGCPPELRSGQVRPEGAPAPAQPARRGDRARHRRRHRRHHDLAVAGRRRAQAVAGARLDLPARPRLQADPARAPRVPPQRRPQHRARRRRRHRTARLRAARDRPAPTPAPRRTATARPAPRRPRRQAHRPQHPHRLRRPRTHLLHHPRPRPGPPHPQHNARSWPCSTSPCPGQNGRTRRTTVRKRG